MRPVPGNRPGQPRCAGRLAVLLLLAAAALPGCGYPEAGFYELVLYAPERPPDSSAGAADASPAVVARHAFMVEELTDDTDLTIGFVLLLPHDGALLRVPIRNSADTSRRGWTLAIAEADSGAGDLELTLEHYGERLSIGGRFRTAAGARVQAFEGTMPETGLMLLNPLCELQTARGTEHCAMAELHRITRTEFESVLGSKVDSALRREAQVPAPLPEAAQPAVSSEKKAKRPRPLGGRGGGGR